MSEDFDAEASKLPEIITGILEKALEKTTAYQDAIQPAAQEVGTALQTAGKAVNLAIAPLRAVVWSFEQIGEIILPVLADKFKGCLHRLVTPKLTVAGPTVEALRFAAGEPVLREMFVNLLATSMDAETAHMAHPAFVEIIKQMVPDEARILQYLASFPELEYTTRDDSGWQCAKTIVAEPSGCYHPNLTAYYVDNLVRLRLIHWNQSPFWADGKCLSVTPRLTDFGKQFYAACVSPVSPGDQEGT